MTELQDYLLPRDNDLPVSFRGYWMGSVSSKKRTNTRWTELYLYRTKGGKYICQTRGVTTRAGEEDHSAIEVVDTIEEAFKVFGMGWLARKLYLKCGLLEAEIIE